jgi:hypothetical protein
MPKTALFRFAAIAALVCCGLFVSAAFADLEQPFDRPTVVCFRTFAVESPNVVCHCFEADDPMPSFPLPAK